MLPTSSLIPTLKSFSVNFAFVQNGKANKHAYPNMIATLNDVFHNYAKHFDDIDAQVDAQVESCWNEWDDECWKTHESEIIPKKTTYGKFPNSGCYMSMSNRTNI